MQLLGYGAQFYIFTRMQTQVFLTLGSFHSTLLPCLSCALVREEERVANLSTLVTTVAGHQPIEGLWRPCCHHLHFIMQLDWRWRQRRERGRERRWEAVWWWVEDRLNRWEPNLTGTKNSVPQSPTQTIAFPSFSPWMLVSIVWSQNHLY